MATLINFGWPFLFSVSEQKKSPTETREAFYLINVKVRPYILRTFDD